MRTTALTKLHLASLVFSVSAITVALLQPEYGASAALGGTVAALSGSVYFHYARRAL